MTPCLDPTFLTWLALVPEISQNMSRWTPQLPQMQTNQLPAVTLAGPEIRVLAGMVVLMADARMEPAVAKDMLQVRSWATALNEAQGSSSSPASCSFAAARESRQGVPCPSALCLHKRIQQPPTGRVQAATGTLSTQLAPAVGA